MPTSVEFTRGDLLKEDVDALVNAVNTVGVMGKGLALQFKLGVSSGVRGVPPCL